MLLRRLLESVPIPWSVTCIKCKSWAFWQRFFYPRSPKGWAEGNAIVPWPARCSRLLSDTYYWLNNCWWAPQHNCAVGFEQWVTVGLFYLREFWESNKSSTSKPQCFRTIISLEKWASCFQPLSSRASSPARLSWPELRAELLPQVRPALRTRDALPPQHGCTHTAAPYCLVFQGKPAVHSETQGISTAFLNVPPLGLCTHTLCCFDVISSKYFATKRQCRVTEVLQAWASGFQPSLVNNSSITH